MIEKSKFYIDIESSKFLTQVVLYLASLDFFFFLCSKEAERAVESIDGYKYGGHKLSVTFYEDCHKPEPNAPEVELNVSQVQ